MTDQRRVDEYRIPAASLRPGDLVNLAPGDDDWQEVRVVHTSADTASGVLKDFLGGLSGQYVYVEVTDLASVDNTIYVDGTGAGFVNGEDEDDYPVSDVLSAPDSARIYLFTKYELVTVRAS